MIRNFSSSILSGSILVCAVLAATPGFAQKDEPPPLPYQDHESYPYYDPVKTPGKPTVYLSDWELRSPIQNNVNLAVEGLRTCNKSLFDDAIKSLRFYLNDTETKRQDDPLWADRHLNDANSIASVINWLLAMQNWAKCAPPEHSSAVRSATQTYFAMAKWEAGFDYAHFSPSAGSDGDQWGFTGAGYLPLDHDDLWLDTRVGYHNVSSLGPSLDNWTLGASLVWQLSDWRIAPSFGYQSSAVSGFSVNAYNYGAYADYFAAPRWDVFGKAGGFTLDPGSDGYYLGGGARGYLTRDFSLSGAIDYTHFNAMGGTDETDFGLRAQYLLHGPFWDDEDDDDDCWPPYEVFAGYTYSNFSPGSFHVDTFYVGIRVLFGEDRGASLVERDRTGPLNDFATFAPLSLKF